MSRDRIVCFGDLANDVVAAPRTAIRPDTDTPSHIRHTAGGSVSNTAAWLGALGAGVDLVACVGIADGDQHAEWLRHHGVVPHLHVAPGLETATIVIMVDGERRTMLTDRGANRALRDDMVTDALLDEAAVLHVTGHSLVDGPRVPGTRRAVERAHERGALVSASPGSAGWLADIGVEAFTAGLAGADILFANSAEALLLTGRRTGAAATAELADRHGVAVVTQGADSVLVAEAGERPITVPVPPVRLIDPTGAGDALAAGFLHRWLAGRDLVHAVEGGILAAAQAVQVYGGRPPF